MPGRGYLFALSGPEVEGFLGCTGPDDRERWVEGLLAAWDRSHLAELDKAWPAIHRCLGPHDADLTRAWMGGLAAPARARLVALTIHEAVPRVARALEALDEEAMRDRFFGTLQGEPDDESAELDFLYTWQWFQRARELYRLAAAEGRAVLFTVRDEQGARTVAGEGRSLSGADPPTRLHG